MQECPGCAPLTANLADGRGANLHTFGGDFDFDVADGVHLSNKAQFTGGDMPTAGIFTGSAPPVTMSQFIASAVASANANTALSKAGIAPASGGTATYVAGGAVNPNQYVMTNGFWVVDKQLQSFTDDLRFTFDVVSGNKLTVGGYFAFANNGGSLWARNATDPNGNHGVQASLASGVISASSRLTKIKFPRTFATKSAVAGAGDTR